MCLSLYLAMARSAGWLDTMSATAPRRKMQLVISMERWLPAYRFDRMFSVPAMMMRVLGLFCEKDSKTLEQSVIAGHTGDVGGRHQRVKVTIAALSRQALVLAHCKVTQGRPIHITCKDATTLQGIQSTFFTACSGCMRRALQGYYTRETKGTHGEHLHGEVDADD